MNKNDFFNLFSRNILVSYITIALYYFIYFSFKGEIVMTKELFLEYILPPLVTFLVALLTYLLTRHSQIKKNTEKVEELNRLISENNKLINLRFGSVYNDIGRKDYGTLTQQHFDIKNILNKEIEVVERRYIEEEKRLNNFTIEQHNTAKTLEDFKLFMDSWERTTAERNDLVIENIKLKEENRDLIHKIKELAPKHNRDRGFSR